MTDKNPSERCPLEDLDAKLPEIWTLQNAIPDQKFLSLQFMIGLDLVYDQLYQKSLIGVKE